MSISNLVKKSKSGEVKAINQLVEDHQDMVYNLSIRMLWHPDDAKDATQEILVKMINGIGSFNEESSFQTWVYSIATNHLITFNKKRYKAKMTLDEYKLDLYQNFANEIHYTKDTSERKLLVQEAKVGCSNAMLQCLNEEERITYILGEILEFNSQECCEILEITPEAFRKRLSRVRSKFNGFLSRTCGIVNKENNCRCHKKVDSAIIKQRIDPTDLLFVNSKVSDELIASIEEVEIAAQLYRTNPDYKTPKTIKQALAKV